MNLANNEIGTKEPLFEYFAPSDTKKEEPIP